MKSRYSVNHAWPVCKFMHIGNVRGAQGWVRHHSHAVELLRFSAPGIFSEISCNGQTLFIARTLQDVRHKFCHRAFRAAQGKARGCFSPLRGAVPAR
ncbi:hypothetical protein SBA1_1600002 [Candidatus Sulfotelmatobacter kueseliae]|uniref:Uncharacterized protein n=1 Tax=Candidatus Sulfotelmatobacter kueseliae TaxID=2042962 RepID=A0A2U3KAS5_9BACT|nr:hypothetical protein SBA1_1600002 [Candidatus Sulfotelmatobacter kueseliae]